MWMGLQEQGAINLELCEGETLANGLSVTHGLLEAKQNKEMFCRNVLGIGLDLLGSRSGV